MSQDEELSYWVRLLCADMPDAPEHLRMKRGPNRVRYSKPFYGKGEAKCLDCGTPIWKKKKRCKPCYHAWRRGRPKPKEIAC